MNDEERVDEGIRRLAEGYHRPPPTPRAEMWTQIQAERAGQRQAAAPRVPIRWVAWAAGLAATLAVGVAIGRFTAAPDEPPGPVLVSAPAREEPAIGSAYGLATAEHFGRVETFLTVFRAEDPTEGWADREVEERARQLLRRTRLLRASPAAQDLAVRALLDDIEFVLLQITSVAQGGGEGERAFVDQGINERSVLRRLRSAVPAGSPRAGLGGAS